MHNILFCFAEKDVKNIIFPSADDVYEMLEPFGVDYLVDVKLEEEYLEDFIEYFSRFGRISYQKNDQEKYPYYKLNLSPEIKYNFFNSKYQELIEYITYYVNPVMLQEKYVRLKIKDIVERELGFNFIGLFDGGISDVYTLTEFVTYFIDSSKETEIRIYNIFSYHF